MIIDIQMVNSLNKKWMGCTKFTKEGNAIIQISSKRNQDIGSFAMTLIHELLHVWVIILKANEAAIDLRKDHKFIYAVEKSISKLAKKLLKGKSK